MVENIVLGITTGICVIFTIILLMGKGAMLVAGFNTMPKEKRDSIDSVALSKFMGVFLIFITIAIILLWVELSALKTGWLEYLAVAIILAATVLAVIYTWGFKRFKK